MDQPASLASLVLAVAARRGVPVAYVPGLVMRRAADLYPGEAKTDRRDAFVLAGTGRTRSHQVHWLDGADHALLAQLRVLNGDDDDLAADATRLSNRLVTALTGVSPALERVSGPRLHHPGVCDLLARYPVPEALAVPVPRRAHCSCTERVSGHPAGEGISRDDARQQAGASELVAVEGF